MVIPDYCALPKRLHLAGDPRRVPTSKSRGSHPLAREAIQNANWEQAKDMMKWVSPDSSEFKNFSEIDGYTLGVLYGQGGLG